MSFALVEVQKQVVFDKDRMEIYNYIFLKICHQSKVKLPNTRRKIEGMSWKYFVLNRPNFERFARNFMTEI